MGKSTEPPKCKTCGLSHRGPCWTPSQEVITSNSVERHFEISSKEAKERFGVELVASPPLSQPTEVYIGKRGRPATGFDKKEYDRKKAAERRAKLKAEGK